MTAICCLKKVRLHSSADQFVFNDEEGSYQLSYFVNTFTIAKKAG